MDNQQSRLHPQSPTRLYLLILTGGDFSGPEHPPSLDYVLSPEYPEYLAPSDDEIPVEDQPLLADASPTALSPSYVVDSDPEEDPEEDPADYPADEGDDDDEENESSEDDDNDEEKEDEEEHLAPVNSVALPAIDLVPSVEETEPFEIDESAPTPPPPPPRSPRTKVPFSQTRLHRARKTVRHQPPMAASTEALIAEYIPYPPLHVPSPPLPLPSPPLLLPSSNHRDDIPKAVMPLQKRARFTAPASMFESHDLRRGDQGEAQISLLTREMRYFRSMASSYEREAAYARQAWTQSESRSQAMEAHIRALKRDVNVLQRQRISDGDRLTSHIQYEHDRFREVARTRDAGHQDGPADAGSSC
ncbi:hypothetical protein Tco_1134122 [Tanacetum coccineum]